MSLFADELGSVEDEITAGTEHGVEGGKLEAVPQSKTRGELKFSEISQKTPDMYSASSAYIGDVSKRADQEPQQFPTIEPFLLLSPFSPRWFSLHRGFFLPSIGGFLQSVEESPADKPPNVPKSPPTGTIIPLTSHPESRFLQPVGESARWQLTQSPETATHWNNHPAYKPLSVPILPVTGRIAPLERVYWRHE